MNSPPINSLPRTLIAPRDFLRPIMIGEGLSEEQYEKFEQERGYKTQCGKVLSVLLGASLNTIRCGWGKTLDFETMPEQHRYTLGYIENAGISVRCAIQIRSGAYRPKSLSTQKFLAYALGLDNLSTSERDARLSRNGFIYECARALSSATGMEYETVLGWGNDIRFHKMPSEHERTLYYAQAAMKVLNQTTQQLIAA